MKCVSFEVQAMAGVGESIAAVTAQTEGDVQMAADMATQLNEVARELNEVLSGFRV